MDNGEKKSLLFRIGLGRKAGKLIIGAEMVCDGVRDGTVLLVLVASDASQNSRKRILGCADYYNAEVETIDVTTEELGAAIGKSAVACVGVTDENIVRLINSRNKNK